MKTVLVTGVLLFAAGAFAQTMQGYSGYLLNLSEVPNKDLKIKVAYGCSIATDGTVHSVNACTKASKTVNVSDNGLFKIPSLTVSEIPVTGVPWYMSGRREYATFYDFTIGGTRANTLAPSNWKRVVLLHPKFRVHRAVMPDGSTADALFKTFQKRGIDVNLEWKIEQVLPNGKTVFVTSDGETDTSNVLCADCGPMRGLKLTEFYLPLGGSDTMDVWRLDQAPAELAIGVRTMRMTIQIFKRGRNEETSKMIGTLTVEGDGATIIDQVPEKIVLNKLK